MAKQGTPVKRVVMNEDGISSFAVPVPGPDYPEKSEKKSPVGGGDFDGTKLLPGAHVGDGILRGMPDMNFGGGVAEWVVDGEEGEQGPDGVVSDV